MWRQPRDPFGPNVEDHAMMQEVLDLLATDSPEARENVDRNTASEDANPSATDTLPELEQRAVMNEEVAPRSDDWSFEEKQAAVYATGQERQDQKQEEDQALDFSHHIQSSIPSTLAPPDHSESTKQPLQSTDPSWFPRNTRPVDSSFSARDLRPLTLDAAMVDPSYSHPKSQLPATMEQTLETLSVPPVQSAPVHQNPSQPDSSTREAESKIQSAGKRVHPLDSPAFTALRRKLRMQTASRRYRKRKKDEAWQQKMRLQKLQGELSHFQELEAQSSHYQQRSVESLEEELSIHKAEVRELTGKVQGAAKEELDWVNAMRSHRS